MADGDVYATEFASTTAGLQAAIDYLAGGKGKVFIGPGTLEITTVISLHTLCHVQGAGVGATVVYRATGSLATGDAAYSGNTFINTAYGANGTLRTTTGDSDITISDMTLDGNYSAFGSVTVGSNNHIGIRLAFVDGVRLSNLRVQNYLQSAIEMNECRNTFTDNVYMASVGQYASATSRNGLDYLNNAGSASGYSCNHVATNLTIDVCTDSPLHVKNNTDVSISNVTIKGGSKYGLEIESTNGSGPDGVKRVTLSNVTAESIITHFIGGQIASGTTLEDLIITNCVVEFDSTHATNGIALLRDIDAYGKNIRFVNCVFTNINPTDTINVPFFKMSPTSTTATEGVLISGCRLVGGSTVGAITSCHGIALTGNFKDLSIVDCDVLYNPGVAIQIVPNGSSMTTQRVIIRGNRIVNCGHNGIQLLCNTGTGNTVKDCIIDGNIIEDACRNGGSTGILVGTDAASNDANNITVSNNRCIKVSNATMTTAIRVNGTGTTDEIHFHGNNTQGLTNDFVIGGTPTNLHCRFPEGLGTSITAAATISIPKDGTVFHVTGNTNITNGISVSALDNGRIVTLIFDGTPTVSDTGTSKLSAALVAAADTTLTLRCDGTNWYEVSRSVN